MKTVAVIFGGRSAEHDVSIITGHTPIIDSLQAAGGFDVWPIYIARDGTWYCDKIMNDLAFFKQDDYLEKLKNSHRVKLEFGQDGLTLRRGSIFGSSIKVDLVFPAMHGTYGEDGSLMGLLRMANVPFVGCDLFASAVAMDKVLMKQVVSAENVPVVPYTWCTKKEWEENQNFVLSRIDGLKGPYFVKPVHLGSSIAISKAKNKGELINAIDVAFHFDDKVLIEESIEDLIEVTLPIMGNEEPQLGGIEQPLSNTEFFDFNDKYMSQGKGKTQEGANSGYSQIPAHISDDLSRRVNELGLLTYETLGCSGIARVDFLIDKGTDTVYVNEVNTLPGSLYHHNWKAMGVSNIELVTKLVTFAEERFEAQQALTQDFKSDILKHVGGAKTGE